MIAWTFVRAEYIPIEGARASSTGSGSTKLEVGRFLLSEAFLR